MSTYNSTFDCAVNKKLTKSDKNLLASLIRIDNCCDEVRPSQRYLGNTNYITREHANRRLKIIETKKKFPLRSVRRKKIGYKDQTKLYFFDDIFYDFEYREKLAKIDPRFGVWGMASIARAVAISRKKITQQNSIYLNKEQLTTKDLVFNQKSNEPKNLYQKKSSSSHFVKDNGTPPLRFGPPPWVRSDEDMFNDIAEYELDHPGELPFKIKMVVIDRCRTILTKRVMEKIRKEDLNRVYIPDKPRYKPTQEQLNRLKKVDQA